MAINKTRLTKDWIDYLKSNQIAASSKETPGKLDYKKKVTSDNLSHFLEVKTDFNEEQISNAIHMVLAKKAQGAAAPKLQNNPTTGTSVANTASRPEPQAPKQIGSNQPKARPTPPKSKYSKDGATDIKFRDINEELDDSTAYALDEKDIEDVFSILTSATPPVPRQPRAAAGGAAVRGEPVAPNPEENQSKKEEEVRKLKRVIRDTMSPAQRKALWRVLTDA